MISPVNSAKRPRTRQFSSSNAFDADGNPMDVLGWPGYRTSRNKSGLDYLETQAEWGHMQGLFLRWLVVGKFRTRNPFYLLGMTAIGLLWGGLPLLLILHEAIIHGNWAMFVLLIALPNTTIGILLLINVVTSLLRWKGETITGD
jgi:hypothetical protein